MELKEMIEERFGLIHIKIRKLIRDRIAPHAILATLKEILERKIIHWGGVVFDRILQKPIILYLDRVHLWKKEHGLYYKYHYPHFIIVNRKLGDFYEIIDPDDGKIKRVEARKLSKAK